MKISLNVHIKTQFLKGLHSSTNKLKVVWGETDSQFQTIIRQIWVELQFQIEIGSEMNRTAGDMIYSNHS
jgi:hypothetical protein